MGELAKRVLERRRQAEIQPLDHTKEVPEPATEKPQGKALPCQIGDAVRYQIPEPDSNKTSPDWVQHTGRVVQMDPVGEMALIVPETEPGLNWRWVAWCYSKQVTDET